MVLHNSDNFDSKIVIERHVFDRLRLLISYSQHEVLISQECESYLRDLDTYLRGSDLKTSKSLRLLQYYLDSVTASLSDVAGWLKEAEEIVNLINATNKL
jgi:hypothetical protein